MKKEILESVKEEIKNIALAYRDGHITQEEYVQKMNAYIEVARALDA